MKTKAAFVVLASVTVSAVAGAAVVARQNAAVRRAAEDVRGEAVRTRAGLRPSDTLLFNGWGLTPAGTQVPLDGDMPLKMAISPDGQTMAVVTGGYNNTGLTIFHVGSRKVTQFVPLARAWNGVAWSRDGKRLFVSGGGSGLLHVFDCADGRVTLKQSVAPKPVTTAAAPAAVPTRLPTFLAGIAVHPTTGTVYVCNEGAHEVWALDPETLQLQEAIAVGAHPHSCLVGGDRRYLYVSNWGGQSVSIIDVQTNQRVRDIPVGIRPNDMAMARDGRLFVACAGDNTVHVIATGALETPEQEASPDRRPPETTREVLATSLYPSSPEGSTPDGVAVSPDGRTLFVANADNNSVFVADIGNPGETRVAGFLPVGWYPTALAVSPDNDTLFVANGKGLLSRPSFPPSKPRPTRLHTGIEYSHPARLFDGSISCISRPTPAAMATFTEQVRRNSPYTPECLRRAPFAAGRGSVLPAVVGGPCPLRYVLYIIKENRTYDQVFGDMKDKNGRPLGNGDPRLTMYGEKVTPNQHQLAREYVLLDNLYCNSEVSFDGHSWTDAAIATDWNQRSWTMSYSGRGDLPGNVATATPAAGYLWDQCRRSGVSFKTYGKGARIATVNRGTFRPGRDRDRVDDWIADLHAAEKTGDLPQFMIMGLGENHTKGTKPGEFTPEACVASNDIAVGKIVAAATRSTFWPRMAIFIIEDDAQNGADHVDAHRTAGLVISPYTKRAMVDSTLYSTTSMIRSLELILGLPPLTQYDAGATPMFKAFGAEPNSAPYDLRQPQVNVEAKNPPRGPGARASARMNFAAYDDFDADGEDTLNRILWTAAKGPGVPYPAPVHRAVFTR